MPSARGAGRASLLHDGRRLGLSEGSVAIGRLPDNDVTIESDGVSRRHARVDAVSGGYCITDLGSRNGTLLNGARFHGESRWLTSGDTIMIGGETLRFVSGDETKLGATPQQALMGIQTVPLARDHLTLGRDPSNDVVLDDPNVSRFHAEVARAGEGIALRDLASRNGTRVNGKLVRSVLLEPGSEVAIGPYRLIFDGASFVARAEQGALRLDAERVVMMAGDKQILAETTLSIEPGQFVAFIGESGSGKTTLLKTLAGVTSPTEGTVRVNGEAVASRLTDIGYLPQDEIVHSDLTVTESLWYSARLRLPADTSEDEIATALDRVLEDVGLERQAGTRIGSLSGGQRKRVGVATELLGRPSLLFLDEPTTGLDPGLESRMMALMRELSDNSRAVTVVTHATKNLGLCDQLVVMGRGGLLCFHGSPDDALGFFGAETYDDIYPSLAEREPEEWQHKFASEQPAISETALQDGRGAPPPRQARGRMLQQMSVLTARYARLFLRDRRNVIILLAQIPILALAIAGLFKAGAFDKPPKDAGQAVKLTFLLLVTTLWIGSIDAAREIVKERSVVARETAVGVRLSSYLASKGIVLFALAAVQSLVLAGIVLVFQPLHEKPATYVAVLAIIVLTSFAAVGMGLVVSAGVRNQDQATSFIPLVLIPQLFFGGSIVAVAEMSGALQAVTKVVVAQWSYAGLGAAIDMNGRINADPAYRRVSQFGSDYFTLSLTTTYLILLGFVVAFFLWTGWLLRRRVRAG